MVVDVVWIMIGGIYLIGGEGGFWWFGWWYDYLYIDNIDGVGWCWYVYLSGICSDLKLCKYFYV